MRMKVTAPEEKLLSGRRTRQAGSGMRNDGAWNQKEWCCKAESNWLTEIKTESKDVLERTRWAGRAASLLSNSVSPCI